MKKLFKNKKYLQKNPQKGAAMLISVIFFLFISLAIIGGLVPPTLQHYKIANANTDSIKSYYLAESGMEDAYYRMLNNLPIGTSEIINLGNNSSTTLITTINGNQKEIESLGSVDNAERKMKMALSTSAGISFSYGIQVGQGGLYLDSGAIYGNVYANGSITASSSGSNLISGSAISANGSNLLLDQENISASPYAIIFGNANNTQDVAQSFKVSNSLPLNKISLYLKKTGSPSNATIRILNNSGSNPGSTILATATLNASSVTTNFGWIDISFSSNPVLSTGTTYWITVDASSSSSNFYTIGSSIDNLYSNGIARTGRYNNSWAYFTTPNEPDYFFRIYLGGVNGLISGQSQWNRLNIGTVSGITQANTVNYVNSTGEIYCQSGTSNNKLCSVSSDPGYIAFPVSEANLNQWKIDAEAGGVHNGNYSVGWAGASLGPKKIVGNLSVSSGGVLNITGPVWVTGNIVLNGGGLIKLDDSYGSNDGILIADGTVAISGGAHATGSSTPGSYIMLISLSSSTSAMSISGGAGAVIVFSPYGTTNVSGGASLKEAISYKLNVTGGSNITYETGLVNTNFSSGPSGSWSFSDWKEI
jgi:hypothetical protein